MGEITKRIVFSALSAIFISAIFIGTSFYVGLIQFTPSPSPLSFSTEYTNDTDSPIQIRYKYMLTYQATTETSVGLKAFTNLYTLYQNGATVGYVDAEANPSTYVEPQVSSTSIVLPGVTTTANFLIKVGEDNIAYQEDILFDCKVYIEELVDGKWAIMYQASFAKRGPYWSLTKGPYYE